MDYLKEHIKITSNECEIIKRFIIDNLILDKSKGRTFEKSMSNLQNLFYEKFTNQSILNKHITYFEPMCNDLIHHINYYDSSKCDSILKTLEFEIHDKFLSVIETFRTYNINPDFSENMSYEKFYPEILKYFLYKRVYNRLDNSIPHLTEAIKLFFEIDNYSDLRTSFLIDESEKVTILKINNIFKKHNRKLVLPKKENQEITNKLNEIENISSLLTIGDKLLLLHLCLKEKTGIPMSEQIKLILLSQKISDYSIFYEDSNINKLYNRINKGFNYLNRKEFNIDIINKLLMKIENLGLTKTKEALISIKTHL